MTDVSANLASRPELHLVSVIRHEHAIPGEVGAHREAGARRSQEEKCAGINAWNRLNIAGRTVAGAYRTSPKRTQP